MEASLGPPESWPSPLIRYRLEAGFQTDWKVELGQWLKAAEEYGFLDRILHDLKAQAQRPLSPSYQAHADSVDPNDKRHLKLHQYLAACRVTHYLTALGWTFGAFEPETGAGVDIDLSLQSPDGTLVEIQVKAPDQPGRRVNGRIVDGERDERVLTAIRKAAKQLRRPPTTPAVIAVCANRDWPLSWHIRCLVKLLVGSTAQVGSHVFIERAQTGAFFKQDWDHISGVFCLDLARGPDVAKYICVALLNPNAVFSVSAEWFPHARVSEFTGNEFRWLRGEPDASTLPEGTQLVETIPESALAELRTKLETS